MWWLALAVIGITVAAYADVWRFDFVSFDDHLYVTGNPHVRAGLTWTGVIHAFSAGYAANWHPLTWLSHMIDVELFGLNPGPPHVVNLVLHAANALLVWLVLRRMTGSVYRSAVVAALFGVHPLHVESVAWIAERKDVLSTFFALLTIWAYAGYARQPTPWRYAAALAWFALGLMAKPMLVTVPFLLVLLDVWPLRRVVGWTDDSAAGPSASWWRIVREKVPFLMLAAASSALTMVAQQRGGAIASLETMSMAARITNALAACAMYLRQTFWPTDLAVFYPQPGTPPFGAAIVAFVLVTAVTVAALRWARQQPHVAVGWLWFLGALVPVIGLVQIGVQARADRYTYLPHVGLFIAVVWGLAELSRRWAIPKRVIAVVAISVVTLCAAATRIQASYWGDGVGLWERAIAVTHANGRAYSNLGASLAGAGRHTEAVAAYRQALAIDPQMPPAHNNLGLALAALGRTAEATAHYREALRLNPDYADAHNNLANALMDQQQVDEAVTHFRAALRLRPGNAQVHNNLGAAYAEQGRMTDATAEFLEAVRLEPDRADWYYAVGMAYVVQGARTLAIEYLQSALKLDPSHDRARRALADLKGPGGDR